MLGLSFALGDKKTKTESHPVLPSQPSVPVFAFQRAFLNKNQNRAGDCPNPQTIPTVQIQLFSFSIHHLQKPQHLQTETH